MTTALPAVNALPTPRMRPAEVKELFRFLVVGNPPPAQPETTQLAVIALDREDRGVKRGNLELLRFPRLFPKMRFRRNSSSAFLEGALAR